MILEKPEQPRHDLASHFAEEDLTRSILTLSMMTYKEKLEFYRWCARNQSLCGLRYCSEAGEQGCIRSSQKPDTLALEIRGRSVEIPFQELIRHGRKGFDQSGEEKLGKLLPEYLREAGGIRPQSARSFPPSVQKTKICREVSKHPKLIDLVRRHVDLLKGVSETAIPRFFEKVEMPFLNGTDFASEMRMLRECFPLNKGPLVHRPFEGDVPEPILRSLEGRLKSAASRWERDPASFGVQNVLRNFRFVPKERRRDILVLVAINDQSMKIEFTDLFDLYDENFGDLLGLEPQSYGPSVIAYAAHLVARSATDNARQLISALKGSQAEEFKPFLGFLEFLVTSRPQLQGTKYFNELSASDLFLAACYYPNDGMAKSKLEGITDWSLPNLRESLQNHEWNDFLVRGAQPRIAEIAFGEILKALSKDDAASDLNLNRVRNVPLEFPLPRGLPSADWQTANGDLIDVKSNFYLRSKAEHLGLRGLLINRPDRGHVRWAGFVFHDSSIRGCSWSYVGEMSWLSLKEGLGESRSPSRVLPFLFSLPADYRWTRVVGEDDANKAAKLIAEPELLLGWCLASSKVLREAWKKHKKHGDITIRFLEALSKESFEFPLEFRLWRTLTEHSITECSAGRSEEVEVLHGLIIRMLAAGTVPLCIPRIGEGRESLLHHWCTTVLGSLMADFDRITCPNCKNRNFSLAVSRITGGGAIFGRMVCLDGCDLGKEEITILTHCHKCRAYPLVLGRNRLCEQCNGLICESDDGSGACGACRSGCTGSAAVEGNFET